MAMNADRREIREATDRMNELLYREEKLWMQKYGEEKGDHSPQEERYLHRSFCLLLCHERARASTS